MAPRLAPLAACLCHLVACHLKRAGAMRIAVKQLFDTNISNGAALESDEIHSDHVSQRHAAVASVAVDAAAALPWSIVYVLLLVLCLLSVILWLLYRQSYQKAATKDGKAGAAEAGGEPSPWVHPVTFAFCCVLFINFVDQVGISFTLPVMVPYGSSMGADMETIAVFSTVRGIGGMIAAFWMPRVSDAIGRKPLILMGLAGRSLGYLLQGCAAWSQTPIAIFMFARILAGLFSGSQPVVSAYVTELYGQDKDLLSKRIVLSQVAAQLASIALQPMSGILAVINLQLPFFVCSGVTMLGCIFTMFAFKEAKHVVPPAEALTQHHDDRQQAIPPAELEQNHGSPLFDAVIIQCFVGFFSIVVTVSSIPFIVPYLLREQSFGLQRETFQATQGAIAKAQANLFILPGLLNVLVMLFLYFPVTKVCGVVPTLLVAGVVAGMSYFSVGYWVKSVWQLNFVLTTGGLCVGFLIPSVGPLVARYSSVRFPNQMAFAQAIPSIGANLASAFGQNVQAFILRVAGMAYCWKLAGLCMVNFTIMLGFSYTLVERRVPQKPALTPDDRSKILHDALAGGNTFLSDAGHSNLAVPAGMTSASVIFSRQTTPVRGTTNQTEPTINESGGT